METSEGDDIPQGLAKCYMNLSQLCSGNISLRPEWNSVPKTDIFKLRFLFLSTSNASVAHFHYALIKKKEDTVPYSMNISSPILLDLPT